MAARVTEKRTKKTRTHSNDENRRMENRFICSVHALPFTRSSTSSIFNIHRRETGTYRQDYMVNSRSAEILLCHTCTLIPKYQHRNNDHNMMMMLITTIRARVRTNGNALPPHTFILAHTKNSRKKMHDNKIYDRKTIDREIGMKIYFLSTSGLNGACNLHVYNIVLCFAIGKYICYSVLRLNEFFSSYFFFSQFFVCHIIFIMNVSHGYEAFILQSFQKYD